MTTIAIDEKLCIAWDSQVTYGNIALHTMHNKCIEVGGIIYAYCGMECMLPELIKHIKGKETPYTLPPDFSYTLITIDKNGEVWQQTEKSFTPVRVNLPYATGSGSDLALGAMAAGASAYKAVEIAKKYDVYTGGMVQWRNLYHEFGRNKEKRDAAE